MNEKESLLDGETGGAGQGGGGEGGGGRDMDKADIARESGALSFEETSILYS
jgi:hypothetical protein